MSASDLRPVEIGNCLCGGPVYITPGKVPPMVRGNLVCEPCMQAICGEQPPGPGKTIPDFREPVGR